MTGKTRFCSRRIVLAAQHTDRRGYLAITVNDERNIGTAQIDNTVADVVHLWRNHIAVDDDFVEITGQVRTYNENIEGKNKLGKLLMKVRGMIREERGI